MNYGVLLDSQTNRVLAVGTNYSALTFVKNCMPDTHCRLFIDGSKYKKFFSSDFFLVLEKPESYPIWIWDTKKQTFKKTASDSVDELLRNNAILASRKLSVIGRIMGILSSVRYEVSTGVMLQESVYLSKRIQAKEFKDAGYDEKLIVNYPYVFQYADFLGTTFKQAADEILLKAKFDDDLLAKTELLRLTYFEKVKKADTAEQLNVILRDFIRVCFVNAQV
jgi:hypothetical protein